MKYLLLLLTFCIQDSPVTRLVDDLRANDLEKRATAEKELGRLLAQKAGDVEVFKALKAIRAKEQETEVQVRLAAIMAPFEKGGLLWDRDLEAPIDRIVECNEAKDRIVLFTRHKVAPHCYPCQLQLRCLSAKTGEPKWTGSEPFGQNPANGLVVGDRYIGTNSMDLMCFDLKTGAKSWTVHTRHSFGDPVVEGDRIYINGFGWFTCFDLDGKELWNYHAKGWLAPPVFAGKRLVTGSSTSGLICLNREDGSVAWSQGAPLVPLALDENRIICAGSVICARSIQDGSETWAWTPEKGDQATIFTVAKGAVVVCTHKQSIPKNPLKSSMDATDLRVHVLDSKLGTLRFTVPNEGALAFDGDVVRVGAKAYKATDGSPVDVAPPAPAKGFQAFGTEFRYDQADAGEMKGTVLRAHRLKALDEK